MFICNNMARQVLRSALFEAGNRQITFVNSYCYLGCIIDDELSLVNEYRSVYRKADRKVHYVRET